MDLQDSAPIIERLAWLRDAPDGVLLDLPLPELHIWVIKQESQIGLFFLNPASGALDGPMSRIDIARPLHLLAPYTRALLLTLLWRPAPRRVCILGFGGGRLSLVLHTGLPEITLDNVDIDPAFESLASRFFGVSFDERQRLHTADAAAFLESTPQRYDIIIMDAFSDARDNLDHLATGAFYAACRRRLAADGVIGVNLLRSDPRFALKAAALRAGFRATWAVPLRHSLVVFGAGRAPGAMPAERATDLTRRYRFDFELADLAATLRPLRDLLDG